MIEVDVRELLAHPGSSRPFVLDRPVEGVRLELAGMAEGAAVRGDLLLESVVEGVLVSGPLRGPLTLTCARCLTEFDGSFEVDVQELFVAPGRDAGPDDYTVSPEGAIDLEPLVRDNVLPALPFSPLHAPDCRGLCERCGGNRNLGECSCVDEPVDARWAALDALFADAPDGGGA
ncbi:MAG TPA: DUF177 domain-containing protein [Actinomycetota bacterium]